MNKAIEVLYVSPIPPPYGGIASWTMSVKKWAHNNNQNIHVVNTSKGGSSQRSVSDKNRLFAESKRTYSIISQLLYSLKNKKIKIIHINSSGGFPGIYRDFLCAKISKHFKKRIVFQLHCDVEHVAEQSRIANVLINRISELVNEVWVLNEKSNQYIKERNHKAKVSKVPNFIEPEWVIDEKKISEEIKKIGYLGTVSNAKGFAEIVKAAQKLKNIDFHLIGPINSTISEESFPTNIKLEGSKSRKEAIDLLREMDLFLFPSYSEGFSIAMLEAMSQGLPIITTPVGSNVELIEGLGGHIVEIGNVEQIVNSVEMMRNKAVRSKMSRNNIDTIKNKYTSDITIEKMFNKYEELLGESN